MPTPQEIQEELDKFFGTGGAKPGGAPAAPERGPPPAGTTLVPGNPNRAISSTVAYTYNTATGQWDAGLYPPSRDERNTILGPTGGSGGTGTRTGTGSTTNYAQQNLENKVAVNSNAPGYSDRDALIQQGGRMLGGNTIIMPNWDKYTIEAGTGLYKAFGRATTTDVRALGTQIASERTSGATFQPGQLTPQAPVAATAPRASLAGPLVPGAPDTRTSSLPSSVNQVAIQNPGLGFNGFINKGVGVRAPASMGLGPSVSTNRIEFSPYERGYTMADRPIAGSVTVPSWMDATTGRNEAGVGVPTSIGVSMGARPDSFEGMLAQAANTVPLQMAGNNVQFNAPDRSWGTGFVLDALPHSNIAMAQGRNFGGLSPQNQAAATWMLLDQQMNGEMSGAYRTVDGAHIFGGGGGSDAGLGWSGPSYAGGGRVAHGPLGRPDLITNEPIIGIGVHSGQRRFLLGEDNADRDRMPDAEAVYFSGRNNSTMDIVPLDPARRFDEGGRVGAEEDEDRGLMDRAGVEFAWAAYTQGVRDGVDNSALGNSGGRTFGNHGRDAEWLESMRGLPPPPATSEFAGGALLPNYQPGDIYMSEYQNPQLTYAPGLWTPQPPVERPGMLDPNEPYPDPRDPMQFFAEGGSIGPGDGGTQPNPTNPTPTNPTNPTNPIKPIGEGGSGGGGEGGGGGSADGPPSTQPPVAPPPITPPVLPPPPVGPPSVPLPGDPNYNFTDPSLLAPWQKALMDLGMQDARRRTFGYRRTAAGLQPEVGIEVMRGQTPMGEAGPGAFWDYRPQVQQTIGDITGLQRDLTALGPAEDQNPINERLNYLGQGISDFERLRQLRDNLVGAEAGAGTGDAGNVIALQNALFQAQNTYGQNPDPGQLDHLNQLRQELAAAQSALSAGAAAGRQANTIKAEIAALEWRTQGLNETSLRTETADLVQRRNRYTQRQNKLNEVQNLAKIGVPNLSGKVAA